MKKREQIEGFAPSKAALARALNVSRKTIHAHIDDKGHPEFHEPVGWCVEECRVYYMAIGALRNSLRNSDNPIIREAIAKKLRYQAIACEARAKILELRQGVAEGRLVRISEVEDEVMRTTAEFRERMLTLPYYASMRVVGKSKTEMEIILRAAFKEAFEPLVSFRWFSDAQREKLRKIWDEPLLVTV